MMVSNQDTLSGSAHAEDHFMLSSGSKKVIILQKNNLLCVCSAELCNGGNHKEIIERTVLSPLTLEQNIDAPMILQGLDD